MAVVPQLPPDFASYRRLFAVAGPLVLANMCMMAMQLTDRIVLSHYSELSIAAIGNGFLLFMTFSGIFVGIAGYTATFVAHYIGANRPDRVGPTIWQGFYISLLGSIPVMLAPLIAYPILLWFDHKPDLIQEEMAYLKIQCFGAPIILVVTALTGFFSGRSDNLRLLGAQFFGVLINLALCLLLVFGYPPLGIPEMGIKGASIATVVGQAGVLVPLACMFFSRKHREQYNTVKGRSLDIRLFKRIFNFGFPSGMRHSCDLLVWSSFFLFIAGLGTMQAAASNIVNGINLVAFFPLIGMMMAVSVLVGQAQGALRPDLAEKIGWRGLFVGQVWMILWAILFVVIPDQLIWLFHSSGDRINPQDFETLSHVCKVLLRFVAVYCIVDGVNVILLGALQGAGDTKWTLILSSSLHACFFAVMLALKHTGTDLNTLWAVATGFIFILATTWIIRFKSGAWKRIQVIEHHLDDDTAKT